MHALHSMQPMSAGILFAAKSRCVDYFKKEMIKRVPRALLSYISTCEFFESTLEVTEAHPYGSCFSKHFCHVLKTFHMLISLNNALGMFFLSL